MRRVRFNFRHAKHLKLDGGVFKSHGGSTNRKGAAYSPGSLDFSSAAVFCYARSLCTHWVTDALLKK
jgi:hypothetical protein